MTISVVVSRGIDIWTGGHSAAIPRPRAAQRDRVQARLLLGLLSNS